MSTPTGQSEFSASVQLLRNHVSRVHAANSPKTPGFLEQRKEGRRDDGQKSVFERGARDMYSLNAEVGWRA